MRWPWNRKKTEGVGPDTANGECWRAVICSENIQRPTLHIQEYEREDGSRVLEMKQQIWSAITFEADIDPYDYAGKTFERVTLCSGIPTRESWYFYGAKIAPLPDCNFKPGRFVMVFDRCVRKANEPEDA